MNIVNKILNKLIRLKYNNWEKYAIYASKIGVNIGENCSISTSVSFGSEPYLIKIGNNVRISGEVIFVTHDGGFHVIRKNEYSNGDLYGKIEIGSNVFIGTRAIIMPNVKIEDNCIVGAGSIVTKDIPMNSIVAGSPARIISNIEQYKSQKVNLIDYTHNMNRIEKERYLRKKYNI